MAFGTFFKCLNVAGVGKVPEGADASLFTWLLWFLLLPEPIFVKGRLQTATRADKKARIVALIGKLVGLTVLISFLQSSLLLRFSSSNNDHLHVLFHTAFLGYLHIWFIYLMASFCLDISALMVILGLSVRVYDGFQHPLWTAQSFQEAWGTRWNLPVQRLLQRTIYIPLRQHWDSNLPPHGAVLATFAGSGLLHEYNFAIHNTAAYTPGVPFLFFVGMGGLMLGETILFQPIQQHKSMLPTPVVAMLLTLSVAIPVELFFVKSWIQVGVIETWSQLVPTIHCR